MPARSRSARLVLPLAVLTALVTACSSGDDAPAPQADAPASTAPAGAGPAASSTPSPATTSSPATTPAAAAVAEITIADFSYEVPASVPAGGSVRVVNQDREAHTVTLRGPDGPSLVVQGGTNATLTAPAAGTYEVVCDFHGGMTATLVVV